MLKKSRMILVICLINVVSIVFGIFDSYDSYRENLSDEDPKQSIYDQVEYHGITQPILGWAKDMFGKL